MPSFCLSSRYFVGVFVWGDSFGVTSLGYSVGGASSEAYEEANRIRTSDASGEPYSTRMPKRLKIAAFIGACQGLWPRPVGHVT